MYKTFDAILTIIWILDILNLPFMGFLDTTYPVNGLAWLLIMIATFPLNHIMRKEDE